MLFDCTIFRTMAKIKAAYFLSFRIQFIVKQHRHNNIDNII
nr:MAG TPA: hypothetical protein [Caudoviricetes sp.]